MEKVIACCGLNCAECDARTATLKNDDHLREQTAAKWRQQYNATNITAAMIHCTGCIEAGPKFQHCAVCEIRNCAITNGFRTCADCSRLEDCEILKNIHQYVPQALENLKALN